MRARVSGSANDSGVAGTPRSLRDQIGRIVDARPRAVLIGCDQTAADGKRAHVEDHAAVDQRELRRAAADVDVQHAGVGVLRVDGRHPSRAR